MKKYYAIYPNQNGLTVTLLGQASTFCEAETLDEMSVTEMDREPTVWISDETELKFLFCSVRRILKVDA